MKLLRSLPRCSAIVGAALLISLTAPVEAAPHQVLFMGNSFTIGATATVPAIFDALAYAGGQEDPYVQMAAVGGQDFRYHATNVDSQAALNSRSWTHVIIQNYSTEPTHLTSGGRNVSNHFTWGTTLYNQIIANNPATQVVLYETWARSAVHSLITGTSTSSTFASTDQMQTELTENYAALAAQLTEANPDKLPVLVAPAGQAWKNAGALLAPTDPNYVRLFGSDEYHANNNGYYLNAAVFYATIYKSSPVGLHKHQRVQSLGLSLTNPEFLETIAWQTVVANGLIEVDLEFLTQPQPVTAELYSSATFIAVANTTALDIQWYLNGQPVEGANSFNFTIPMVTQDLNGAQVWVVITDEDDNVQSNTVTLKVVGDTTAPEAVEASSSTDGYFIEVAYSELMDAATATRPMNYTVSSGGEVIPVRSASLINEGLGVRLTLLAPVQEVFTVGISKNVTDKAGNSVGYNVVLTSERPKVTGGNIRIDFGDGAQTSSPNWNNVTVAVGQSATAAISNLVFSDGSTSGIKLQMVRRFNGVNNVGTTASTLYPASATRDSLYGNTQEFQGLSNVFPAFQLEGLVPGVSYTLTFFASRMDASDNRETIYTVTGNTVQTAAFNASNNINDVVTVTAKPDTNGVILIELSPGANNNNGNRFTYINVLEVTVPAPASDLPAFEAVSFGGGQITLEWEPEGVLEQATTPDASWSEVTPTQPNTYTAPAGSDVRFFRLKP